MPFAINTILLENIPISYENGRLTLNNSGLAFFSEIADSTGGSSVIPSDVVRTTGDQLIIGSKAFKGGISCELVGVEVYNSSNGSFYDSNGLPSCDMENRTLLTIDVWKIADATESYIYTSIGPGGDISNGNNSINIGNNYAVADNLVSIDWGQKTLYGVWNHTGIASESGHIVNYNKLTGYAYPKSNPNGFITGIPSDVVRTTGNQIITGGKTFKSVATFDKTVQCNNGLYSYDANGVYSLDTVARLLQDSSDAPTVDWEQRELSSLWTHSSSPTGANHIANKTYVDTKSIYSMQFGHASLVPTDSTTYYFGGAFSDLPGSVQATSPVMVVPTSGVLRKIVGNASIMTTLGTAETVSMIVYKNGVAAATGTYLATGYNNKIFSGLSSINLNVNALDTIQLGMSCPAWTINPIGVNNSLVAQISLG